MQYGAIWARKPSLVINSLGDLGQVHRVPWTVQTQPRYTQHALRGAPAHLSEAYGSTVVSRQAVFSVSGSPCIYTIISSCPIYRTSSIGEQVERSWKIRKCQACANSIQNIKPRWCFKNASRTMPWRSAPAVLPASETWQTWHAPTGPNHFHGIFQLIYGSYFLSMFLLFPQHFGIFPPHFHSITAAKLRRFSSAARRQWWRPPWQPPRDFRPRPTAQKEQCREHLGQTMLTAGSKNGKMIMLRNCLLILLIC